MDNSVEFFIRKLRTRTGEVIMTGMTSFSTRNKKHPKKKQEGYKRKGQTKFDKKYTLSLEPPGMSTLHAKMRNKFAATKKRENQPP